MGLQLVTLHCLFCISSQTLLSIPEVVKGCKELQGLLEFLS